MQLLEENVHLLKEIEGCEIITVNRADNFFEFIYQKEGETKYLTLSSAGVHHKFSETTYYKFEISTEPLSPELQKSSRAWNYYDSEEPKKDPLFEDLNTIESIKFYNRCEAYFDGEVIVISGESYYYFIEPQMYDYTVVEKHRYKFLPEYAVEALIQEHGFVTFSQPTDILSQWYRYLFYDENNTLFSSAEQYMMAQKALLFHDKKSYKCIINEQELPKIKALGRKVLWFDQKKWDEHKEQIVYDANYLKFSQNSELKEHLLATGEKMIIEANPNDIVWACGLKEDHKHITSPRHWRGENLLGQILMQVRSTLRKEDDEQ